MMSDGSQEFVSVKTLKGYDSATIRPFRSVLLLRKVAVKTSKTGNEFLSVELGDNTGSFTVTCFNDSPSFNFFRELAVGAVVRVAGQTDYYQDRLSPRIQQANLLTQEEVEAGDFLKDLVASSTEDPDELWEELQGYIVSIEHAGIRKMVENVMEEIGETFRTIPAAISMHHAFRHGLLEHTIHMCRNCKALAPLYKEVNVDLALAGIIVHDTGKVVEYSSEFATQRTRTGILQGHVVLGYRIVRKAAIKAKLDPSLMERLEHIVLSHQGELEWGAAAMAATPEAVFVSMIDNLDAKMGMVQHALRNTPEGEEFSDYIPGLKAPLLVTPPKLNEE